MKTQALRIGLIGSGDESSDKLQGLLAEQGMQIVHALKPGELSERLITATNLDVWLLDLDDSQWHDQLDALMDRSSVPIFFNEHQSLEGQQHLDYWCRNLINRMFELVGETPATPAAVTPPSIAAAVASPASERKTERLPEQRPSDGLNPTPAGLDPELLEEIEELEQLLQNTSEPPLDDIDDLAVTLREPEPVAPAVTKPAAPVAAEKPVAKASEIAAPQPVKPSASQAAAVKPSQTQSSSVQPNQTQPNQTQSTAPTTLPTSAPATPAATTKPAAATTSTVAAANPAAAVTTANASETLAAKVMPSSKELPAVTPAASVPTPTPSGPVIPAAPTAAATPIIEANAAAPVNAAPVAEPVIPPEKYDWPSFPAPKPVLAIDADPAFAPMAPQPAAGPMRELARPHAVSTAMHAVDTPARSASVSDTINVPTLTEAPVGEFEHDLEFEALSDDEVPVLEDAIVELDVPLLESVAEATEFEVMPETSPGLPCDLWVLGASLGGPAALKRFFTAIDQPLPISFLLVQHIDAHFLPVLGKILEQANAFYNVQILARPGLIEPGALLLAPIERRLRFLDAGQIVLSGKSWSPPYAPCIDDVLLDVASAYPGQVNTIVFSGMGADGVNGARAVQAAGGEIWLQEAGSCASSVMPDAIQQAGLSRYRATPEQLATRLMARYRPALNNKNLA